MTNIRKVKRRKRYRMNVNRKRLRNKLRKLPAIECPEIKNAWQVTVSTRANLNSMGLAYDSNEVLCIPNTKKEFINEAKRKATTNENCLPENEYTPATQPAKSYVAEVLEAEAKAERKRLFRLPKTHVEFATYMIDKYGENYKAMVRDKRNYNQLTWKQIRAKIKQFMGIPEQYNAYLADKQIQ